MRRSSRQDQSPLYRQTCRKMVKTSCSHHVFANHMYILISSVTIPQVYIVKLYEVIRLRTVDRRTEGTGDICTPVVDRHCMNNLTKILMSLDNVDQKTTWKERLLYPTDHDVRPNQCLKLWSGATVVLHQSLGSKWARCGLTPDTLR